MDSKLLFKVCKGIKAVGRVEAFLVLAVAALCLAIMPGCVRADELMADTKLFRRCFKCRYYECKICYDRRNLIYEGNRHCPPY